MTEPLPDTWHTRDLPVLREVVRQIDRGGQRLTMATVGEALDMPLEDVRRAALNLERGHCVALDGFAEDPVVWFTDFTEKALRELGAWPSAETALDRMFAALQAIAENTQDEGTRTRAHKILDGLSGAGRTIGLGVATAAITGQLPGH